MIVVVGEALVDLVVGEDGSVAAALGGAPYNAARAASRLGAPVRFVGTLSTDRFGRQLAERLHADGVSTTGAPSTSRPTTLAAAETAADGSASYHFYFEGTSAPLMEPGTLDGELGADVVFTGGLALVLQPLATSVTTFAGRLGDHTLFVVDVNARPAAIVDRGVYLADVRAVLARADVVKVSDEDLRVLEPDLTIDDLLSMGVGAVIVTAGSAGTEIVHAGGRRSVPVPPLDAPVVDTIGAGDTFAGGFMAAWTAAGLGRDAVRDDDALGRLVGAVELAHAAAAVVVTRHGADPPTVTDLPDALHPRLRRDSGAAGLRHPDANDGGNAQTR